jgi:hypothetical protein
MGTKKKEFQQRLKFINEDVKRLIESLPNDVLNMSVYGNYENVNTLLSNIEIASDLKDDESLGWVVNESEKIEVDTNLVIDVPPRYVREDFKKIDIDKMPNQKWHQIVSFIKSGVRIIGYCFIPFNLIIATILLVLSEIIGILEEMV